MWDKAKEITQETTMEELRNLNKANL